MTPPAGVSLSPDPLAFAANPADGLYLVIKLTHVLLYNTPIAARTKSSNPTQAELLAARNQASPQVDPLTPQPGLSQNDLLFLLGAPTATTEPNKLYYKNTQPGAALSPQQVSTTKSAALRFLTSPLIFPDIKFLHKERFWSYLVASCDANSDVQSRGEDGTKKLGRPDTEDAATVKWYYDLYSLGGPTDKTTGPSKTEGLSPTLKTKLLQSVFERSALAGNTFPALLQTSFDALFASTDAKLRMEGMRFAVWCLRVGKLKTEGGGWLDERIGGVLLGGFTKLVEEEPAQDGEARTGSQMLREASARQALTSLAYEAVGLLSSRVPSLFSGTRPGRELLPRMFARLEDPRAVPAERQSVLDALSVLVSAYSGLDADAKLALKPTLFEAIRSDSNHARFAAAKFAARLYPFSDADARVLCLIASTDQRVEIKEEGTSALLFSKTALPNLTEIVAAYIAKTKTEHPPRGKTVSGVPIELHSAAVDWVRCLIFRTAGGPLTSVQFPSLETGEESLLDAETRDAARKYLDGVLSGPDADGMKGYLSMLVKPLLEKTDEVLQGTCAGVLLELVGMGGVALREAVVAMGKGGDGGAVVVDWLKPFLASTKLPLRAASAHLVGLIGSSVLQPSDLSALVASFLAVLDAPKDDKTITLEARHGAMLAIAYLISRLAYRHPDTYAEMLGQELVGKCVSKITSELEAGAGAANASTLLLVYSAVSAVGELGRYVPLPLPVSSSSAAESASSDGKANPRSAVVAQLSDIVKKGKDAKLQETTIGILAHLTLGDPSLCPEIMELYYSLATLFSKQIETHFTVGEAIATVIGGWGSASVRQFLDLAEVPFPPWSMPDLGARDPSLLDAVFTKLEEMLTKGGTAARKAVCVWLLSLVKFCSGIEAFRKKLPQINASFRSLLTDRDEFTQEVASKGIGLVYEMGDKETKAELVKALMGNLVDTKKQLAGDRGTLTGDTQLFDTSLGSAPGDSGSGGGISTYQSVLSLAADLNQPDLVYKFMNVGFWGCGLGFAIPMFADKRTHHQPTARLSQCHLVVASRRFHGHHLDHGRRRRRPRKVPSRARSKTLSFPL